MVPKCHVRRFRFYRESNGELLEDFKHGNNKATKSNLHLGKIILAPVQIRLKRMKQEVGKLIVKLYQ